MFIHIRMFIHIIRKLTHVIRKFCSFEYECTNKTNVPNRYRCAPRKQRLSHRNNTFAIPYASSSAIVRSQIRPLGWPVHRWASVPRFSLVPSLVPAFFFCPVNARICMCACACSLFWWYVYGACVCMFTYLYLYICERERLCVRVLWQKSGHRQLR